MNWQQACELPYYNGTDLGANYTPAATTFKLWAPTASAVTVELFATGTDAELADLNLSFLEQMTKCTLKRILAHLQFSFNLIRLCLLAKWQISAKRLHCI